MEALLIIGVLVTFIVMLVKTGDQNRRIERLEKELGFAKQGYDSLATRLWQLERAFGDALRTIAELRRDLAERTLAPQASREPDAAKKPEAKPAGGASAEPGGAPSAAPAPTSAEPTPARPELAPTDWKPIGPQPTSAPPGEPTWKPVVTQPKPPSMGDPSAAPGPMGAAPPPGAPPSPGPMGAPGGADEPAGVGIDWERWIGVRGAAALGAGILVIAGLYFFKYSIDNGIITPGMRVVLGTLVGLGCIAASQRSLRKSHVVLANWLAGAGIAILYIAFWSAKAMYGLIETEVAFGLMILVTAACVLLSIRHGSIVIAILGLFGGFATPLALSSGSDHPIGLFGYLLLLDVGLLITAQKRRWPALGLLSLGGTLLYQAAWIAERMGPDRLWMGIGIVGLFAAVFTIGAQPLLSGPSEASAKGGATGDAQLTPTAVAAVIAPFGFALYLGVRSDLGPHLYPVGVLVALLAAGASATAILRRTMGGLAVAAGVASVTVIAAWLFRHEPGEIAWEVVGIIGVIAVILHAALEIAEIRGRGEQRPSEIALASTISSLGSSVLVIVGAVTGGALATSGLTPWLAALGLLAALALRQASFAGREAIAVGPAITLGLGLPAIHAAHLGEPELPRGAIYLGLVLAAAVALQIVAMARRSLETKRWGDHAAALLALILLVEPLAFSRDYAPPVVLGSSIALGFLALLAATRRRSGAWAAVAMALVALVQTGWLLGRSDIEWDTSVARTALAFMGASVVLFTAWPRLAARAFRGDAWAWRASALAGPIWFFGLREAWIALFGASFIGALPIALGFVALLSAAGARNVWEPADRLRRTALAWTLGVALGFITVAIPLQLDKEWITVGWALEGAALVLLWKRLDHAGLKYIGLAHLAVASVRLVANPSVLDYHPASRTIILNWLAYTYWLPALCLVATWALLRGDEVARLRPWESAFYKKPEPFAAMAAVAAACLVVFVWINLTIIDAYSSGATLEIVFEHKPARDLTISIAWAIYALVLLALGMTRGSAGLRWASLALILATVGKAFLYDLAHLKDLYRVASLVGLALSLILISIAYQRFVFGSAKKKP